MHSVQLILFQQGHVQNRFHYRTSRLLYIFHQSFYKSESYLHEILRLSWSHLYRHYQYQSLLFLRYALPWSVLSSTGLLVSLVHWHEGFPDHFQNIRHLFHLFLSAKIHDFYIIHLLKFQVLHLLMDLLVILQRKYVPVHSSHSFLFWMLQPLLRSDN